MIISSSLKILRGILAPPNREPGNAAPRTPFLPVR
jgi:hypothetical protein